MDVRNFEILFHIWQVQLALQYCYCFQTHNSIQTVSKSYRYDSMLYLWFHITQNGYISRFRMFSPCSWVCITLSMSHHLLKINDTLYPHKRLDKTQVSCYTCSLIFNPRCHTNMGHTIILTSKWGKPLF